MDGDKIRVLIVDDEPLARETLRMLLSARSDVEIAGECANGKEALREIRARPPELVFLDVQMPEMNGFEMLAALDPAQIPMVIFVTAYDQYSLRAFEVHAVDYLLKPFDDERFEKAVDRALEQIRQRRAHELSRKLLELVDALKVRPGEPATAVPAPAAEESGYLSRLAVKTGERVVFVKVEEIDWIEAADYYVKLHAGGREHLLRESMNHLETRLDPQHFVRIHRSTIVNLDRVQELRQSHQGDSTVVLRDGTRLRLSRSGRDKLNALLERPS